ncbi:sce7726 family protein [Pseudomonas sp. H11T01]|uniref:sce7726 family protein n=1 Tax=Pseudomonas sp. H11T01 TaxID=3402749 RepID=UPI003AC638E3
MKNFRELSKIFSSKCIENLASGDISQIEGASSFYSEVLPSAFTPVDVFEACYKDLSKNYRSEYFFKNVVANKIVLGKHKLSTATLLSEFRVENSKADCVILNGSSTCYEIKSELDNFSRLNDQLKSYKKIFDKIYVVVAEGHKKFVVDNVDESVGLIVLTGRNTLSEVRVATQNKNKIDPGVLIRSLRKNEYIEIASMLSGVAPDLVNTEIFHWCESVFFQADNDLLRSAFCSTLKKTRRADKEFSLELPSQLLMAGLRLKMSHAKRKNLLRILNSPI